MSMLRLLVNIRLVINPMQLGGTVIFRDLRAARVSPVVMGDSSSL